MEASLPSPASPERPITRLVLVARTYLQKGNTTSGGRILRLQFDMSSALRSFCVVTLSLGLPCFGFGQTVVESAFLPPQSAGYTRWSTTSNWSPAEVPNNTPTRLFNVTLSDGQNAIIDIDPTVQNLNASGRSGLSLSGHNLTVTGLSRFANPVIAISGGIFKTDALSTGSGTADTLTGYYNLLSYSGSLALVQFNGAHITSLQNASLTLVGSGAGFADENGNDALRDLARIDKQSSVRLDDHPLVVSAVTDVAGTIQLSADAGRPTSFTVSNGLANFDAATRTFSGGTFIINGSDGSQAQPVKLRFAGADIVNNASHITLSYSSAGITDLNGLDAFRNFARNTPDGQLILLYRAFILPGNFTNDGAFDLTSSTLTIAGNLTNFDASSRTLQNGAFKLDQSTVRLFNADIVRNGGSISLRYGSAIVDASGSDALRNFTDNLASGSFFVGTGQAFNSPGDFTNAGVVQTEARPAAGIPENTLPPAGQIALPAGASYKQTSGSTINDGILSASTVDIRGGSLAGDGTINGNLTVGDATVVPGGTINGSLTLSAGSRVHPFIDKYSIVSEWKQITGTVALAGNLEVEIRYENYLASNTVFSLLAASQVSGAFSNAPEGTRITTTDSRGSFVVRYDGTSVKLSMFEANPAPARLLNISTRGYLKPAQNDTFGKSVLTAGFIIGGTENKTLVLRGLGPSLAAFGVPNPVQDPRIDLYTSARQVIASNNNWRDAQADVIANNGLAPSDERESALAVQLAPGAYTVALRDVAGVGGGALVEVYDLTSSEASKLLNISTRGFLDANDPLIGGVIAREGQANTELIVRALGPQLRRNGVYDAIDDPTLELRDSNGALVAANDDWGTNFNDIINELRPFFSSESAMHVSLPAGNYTTLVRAKGGGQGQALVEIYDLRR